MRTRLIAVLGAALLQFALPAFAKADDLIGVASRPTPISAYAGRLAWSAYNPATNSYSLMTSIGGVTSVVPVPPRSVPFDVDLGPDENGDTVAAYSRCSRDPVGRNPAIGNVLTGLPVWETGRGCDIYRFTFATGRETPIAVANSPMASEFLPTVWKARIAFARVYERKHGIAGRRAYIYARGTAGAGRSQRVPGGSRSKLRFCSGKPRHCTRLLEPGPTALDLGGRRLAFGWDSGDEGAPTTAAYYATLSSHPRKHRLDLGSSGEIQATEIFQPSVDTGQVYWARVLFGDTTANSVRRYRIATGERQQAALPTPGGPPDAFIRSVLALAVDGSAVYYLESGGMLAGEPCTPQQPCSLEPTCTDAGPCRLMVAPNPAFTRFKP